MHTLAAAALLVTTNALQLWKKPVAAPPSAPAIAAADDHRRAVIGGHNWLTHAPPSYFARDKLTVKGPRANTDVGAPVDATRPLVKLGDVAVGSWSSSEGGWLSPAPRTLTEWFIMLEGEGSVDEEDGTRHRLRPACRTPAARLVGPMGRAEGPPQGLGRALQTTAGPRPPSSRRRRKCPTATSTRQATRPCGSGRASRAPWRSATRRRRSRSTC